MKDNKFLVWDKEDKKWVSSRFVLGSEGELLALGSGGSTYYPDKQNRYVICFYTGLHDKNNVEIYEGDILRNDYYPAGEDSWVIFYNGCFTIEDSGNGNGGCLYDLNQVSTIIGNKFENPELLELIK